jgi:methylated-DNA-[protein]-cysteine S-methyltransferase
MVDIEAGGDGRSGLFAREYAALGRAVEVGLASGRVVGVGFPDSPPADASATDPLLDRIDDYLDGADVRFDDVPLALTVPTDHRRVLETVRKLPRGESVSVPRLARLAGFDDDDEEDRRTVEAALRENPVPLLVPDHRVDGPGATPPEVAATFREVERST